MKKEREKWIDNVKVIACVFVVLGHFFQSMTKSGIVPQNDLYQWFNKTIYYFHVPLFFICSGYLYQKFSRIYDIYSWSKNIMTKALNLGVPYFIFSFATWTLKTVFSNSTNEEIGGLIDTFFIHPTAPYWFLYALFLIFFITPTFKSKKVAGVGLITALILKIVGINVECGIQAISYILSNEIWFVIGMCMSVIEFKEHIVKIGIHIPIIMGIISVIISIFIYDANVQNGLIGFLMGLIICFSIIFFMAKMDTDRKKLYVLGFLAKYTMPVFLMHTLFAASFRIALFKMKIYSVSLHVVLGISVSFIGPIAAAVIMKKSKWLEFFLYPGKYIRIMDKN